MVANLITNIVVTITVYGMSNKPQNAGGTSVHFGSQNNNKQASPSQAVIDILMLIVIVITIVIMIQIKNTNERYQHIYR